MPPPSDDTSDPDTAPKADAAPWYADGLRFECTACGKCCVNHGEGFEYVYSTRKERRAIAARLELSLKRFEKEYCEQAGADLSFKSKDQACIFLQDGQCSIYELRPVQCRTFPFWRELLEDEATWERDVADFCPGVGQGPVHDINAIRATMREADEI